MIHPKQIAVQPVTLNLTVLYRDSYIAVLEEVLLCLRDHGKVFKRFPAVQTVTTSTENYILDIVCDRYFRDIDGATAAINEMRGLLPSLKGNTDWNDQEKSRILELFRRLSDAHGLGGEYAESLTDDIQRKIGSIVTGLGSVPLDSQGEKDQVSTAQKAFAKASQLFDRFRSAPLTWYALMIGEKELVRAVIRDRDFLREDLGDIPYSLVEWTEYAKTHGKFREVLIFALSEIMTVHSEAIDEDFRNAMILAIEELQPINA